MSYTVREIDYKGYKIKIQQDEDAESPRAWSNLGIMVCGHSRYNLGDVQVKSKEELEEHLKKAVVALPLYLLDHSGLWLRTGRFAEDAQGWDTSYVGIIYVDRERVFKEHKTKRITKKLRETILGVLESEVETYSDFLEGNVHGYIIEDSDGNEIDSCWGFFPDHKPGKDDLEYVVGEARAAVDYDLSQKAKCEAMEVK